MSVRVISLCLLVLVACTTADTENDPERVAVEIAAPLDGAALTGGTVTVTLGVANVLLRPAGTMEPNTGHHHLFIDRGIVAEGAVIPAEEGVVHLGAAQTSHVFENLAPGEHTVIAVLGDYQHVRIAGAKTDTVRFTVMAP